MCRLTLSLPLCKRRAIIGTYTFLVRLIPHLRLLELFLNLSLYFYYYSVENKINSII